ncbi:polysaccharide deacetylase family protein [Comamonas sp. lk]|uniref:polysaccharide deacetylase family protein n=1 Tax=Comamonas sp. lk TaxID=2201272 RepID=UPI000EAFF5FB|nr:polysaccharide deacetylase family protein [Comamonas sp. lk]
MMWPTPSLKSLPMLLIRPAVTALIACLVCALVLPSARAQRLALSFDDGYNPDQLANARELNNLLLKTLKDNEVKSILFVAGARVDSQDGMYLVAQWMQQGHEVGNHSYSHLNLARADVSLDAYLSDMERNESLLARLPSWARRYRFPYLKEGDTLAKRDGVRQWLSAHHYGSGAVTIDASDWYYDQRLRAWMAAHPGQSPQAFKQPYIRHVLDRARYYAGLARQTMGREVDHVLLLHTNTINALFLDDVIAALREAGWKLIDPSEAYADSVYEQAPDVLPAGESLVWSLAKKQGLKGLRYPAESDAYEKPVLDALGL